MKLCVRNFAKIKEADLDFNGITVIAGDNNTGKSTIGKVMFSFFHGLRHIDDMVYRTRKTETVNSIFRFDLSLPNQGLEKVPFKESQEIFEFFRKGEYNNVTEWMERVNNYIEKKGFYATQEGVSGPYEELQRKIEEIWEMPSEMIEQVLIGLEFKRNFSYQINSLFGDEEEAFLGFNIKGNDIELKFEDNECKECKCGITLVNDAIYIDNPFVLDNLANVGGNKLFRRQESDMTKSLLRHLKTEDNDPNAIAMILAKDKLKNVNVALKNVISGELVKKSEDWYLHAEGFSDDIAIKQLSTGLKSFVIIKRLLEADSLREKDVLILDEPEVHLHPQWQLLYAELIVLLQKAFDLTILMTTHSPYFLDAIEVFAAKHEVSNRVKYYLSDMAADKKVSFKDVTGNIEAIYEKLAKPLQWLESERNKIKLESRD